MLSDFASLSREANDAIGSAFRAPLNSGDSIGSANLRVLGKLCFACLANFLSHLLNLNLDKSIVGYFALLVKLLSATRENLYLAPRLTLAGGAVVCSARLGTGTKGHSTGAV